MATCEELVTKFCNSLAWDVADTELVAYLVNVIKDANDGNDVDLDELAELVQGFFPGFAALASEEQHDRLWNLVEQVGCLRVLLMLLWASASKHQRYYCLRVCPGPAAPLSSNRTWQQQ